MPEFLLPNQVACGPEEPDRHHKQHTPCAGKDVYSCRRGYIRSNVAELRECDFGNPLGLKYVRNRYGQKQCWTKAADDVASVTVRDLKHCGSDRGVDDHEHRGNYQTRS